MLKNPPKLVLTARVEPEIKEQLSAEAAQCDMNLSSYTEYCLKNFNSVLHECQISEERNEVLQKSINTLTSECNDKEFKIEQLIELSKKQAEKIHSLRQLLSECEKNALESDAESKVQITSLENQIYQVRIEKADLSKSLAETIKMCDTFETHLKSRLPITLSSATIEHTTKLLEDLQQHHPDYSHAELLVWALATAARNEKHTYTMYNLKDFKKRNPDFFTSK